MKTCGNERQQSRPVSLSETLGPLKGSRTSHNHRRQDKLHPSPSSSIQEPDFGIRFLGIPFIFDQERITRNRRNWPGHSVLCCHEAKELRETIVVYGFTHAILKGLHTTLQHEKSFREKHSQKSGSSSPGNSSYDGVGGIY